jgi:signal transduction histidine kinase
MRIIGNTSSITLTNGGTLSIGEPNAKDYFPTSKGTALLVMGNMFTLNVEDGAYLIAQSRQTQTFIRTGATLAVRQGGTIHFYGLPDDGYHINVNGGHIRATNYGAGPGVRINGGGSLFNIIDGGSIELKSVAYSFPYHGVPLPPEFNPQSVAIQLAHSRGRRDQLYVAGPDSRVLLYSQGGSAIRGSVVDTGSVVGIYIGEESTFIARGSNPQGIIYGYFIDLQAPTFDNVSIQNHAYNSATLIYSMSVQWRWLLLMIPIFPLLFFIISTLFLKRFFQKKIKTKREQIEWEIFQKYLKKIQQQYATMRTFFRNYQDTLLSLSEYLKNNDLSGLREYYSSKILGMSEEITKSTFVFQHLEKIKVPEIKSILIAKLMLAESLHIHTSFIANEEVNSISIDSVALVRMLGIILDNAIEAQGTQNKKRLEVGCFKYESGVYFIVENNCPKEMPPLYKLWEKNFTTKSENCGLGLCNLLEIVGQIPNATLETDVTEENFSQKLIIRSY